MREENQHDDDVELESRLRAYLETELSGQLGRARQAFERHVATGQTSRTPRAGGRGRFTRVLTIGIITTAAAASLAALWATPGLRQPEQPELATTQPGPAPKASRDVSTHGAKTNWEEVGFVVTSVALDRGTVVLENQKPARLVRQVSLERTEWVDEARGVRLEAFAPRETTQLLGIDTY